MWNQFNFRNIDFLKYHLEQNTHIVKTGRLNCKQYQKTESTFKKANKNLLEAHF